MNRISATGPFFVSILTLSILLSVGCDKQFHKISVQGVPGFAMANNLSCNVLYSTDKSGIGKKLSLLDLETDSPKVLFEGEFSSTYPMKKIDEFDGALSMQWVSTSGSLDTIYLNKKTGVFLRAMMGNAVGEYIVAQKGNCK